MLILVGSRSNHHVLMTGTYWYVSLCSTAAKISTGTPASHGPSATAGLLVLSEMCYHNLMRVIAVSKSQDFLSKVRRLYFF